MFVLGLLLKRGNARPPWGSRASQQILE